MRLGLSGSDIEGEGAVVFDVEEGEDRDWSRLFWEASCFKELISDLTSCFWVESEIRGRSWL